MEPEKSLLICKDSVTEADLEVLREFTFHQSDGERYVGSFIGTKERRQDWLAPKVAAWTAAVEKLAIVAQRYPQSAYAGLTKSLQSE